MPEYSANADQIINPGESAIFTNIVEPCNRGLVRFREGSGNFLLSGWTPVCSRCGMRKRTAPYSVVFGGNIAIPEGETVGEISMAVSLDGTTLPTTQMIVTPAEVNQFFNIGRETEVDIWAGCCETVTIRNTSTIPITLRNATIKIDRPDLR